MKQPDIIVPSGMIPFQCSQSGRCCGGWSIGLDKASYNRLKHLLIKSNQKRLFKENIKKCNKNDESNNYAVIKLTNGRCGLLESSGLCSIHKNYGVEALPDICKVFPRQVFQTPFGNELSITFACPNAAELLKNKEKIVKVNNPKEFHFANSKLFNGKITRELVDRTDNKKYYFEIEDHFIEIMQSRIHTIDERLILLGITIKRLEKPEQFSQGQVLELIKANQNILADSFLKDEVKKIQPDIYQQVFLLKEFINLRLPSITDSDLASIFKIISQVFQFDQPDDNLQVSVESYKENYIDLFSSVSEEVSHIFENYVIYFILRKNFAAYTFKDAYFLMIYFYSLIRLTAIALAVHNKKQVDEDIVVKAVWVIEKAIGHSYQFYQTILDFLRENNLTTVSHAITLLKMPDQLNRSQDLSAKMEISVSN